MKKSEAIKQWGQKGYDEYQEKVKSERKQENFTIDGMSYPRIPWGAEKRFGEVETKPDELCHDCLAEPGMLHIFNCDMEECPKCGNQALSCPCEIAEYTEKSALQEDGEDELEM